MAPMTLHLDSQQVRKWGWIFRTYEEINTAIRTPSGADAHHREAHAFEALGNEGFQILRTQLLQVLWIHPEQR
jgi:hypothetical protein